MLKKEDSLGFVLQYTKNGNKWGYWRFKCKNCEKEIKIRSLEFTTHSCLCRKCINIKKKKVPLLINRICKVCNIQQDISQFVSRNSKYSKLTCYKCMNLKKYGLNYKIYLELLEEQGYKCKICKNTNNISLAVDHDHKSSKIRGLLCTNCNTALGALKDNISLFEKAINYLKNEGNI